MSSVTAKDENVLMGNILKNKKKKDFISQNISNKMQQWTSPPFHIISISFKLSLMVHLISTRDWTKLPGMQKGNEKVLVAF